MSSSFLLPLRLQYEKKVCCVVAAFDIDPLSLQYEEKVLGAIRGVP